MKHIKKPVLGYKEPWMQENGLKQYSTIVSEVSSFVQGYLNRETLRTWLSLFCSSVNFFVKLWQSFKSHVKNRKLNSTLRFIFWSLRSSLNFIFWWETLYTVHVPHRHKQDIVYCADFLRNSDQRIEMEQWRGGGIDGEMGVRF